MVGPLPHTKKGNKYVLVLVDFRSRYPEAVPVPTLEAERMAEELVNIFSQVGIPDEVSSGQGTNFTLQFMKELCELLQVQKLQTAPYHAMGNDLCKRFNGTLKAMLQCCVAEQPES